MNSEEAIVSSGLGEHVHFCAKLCTVVAMQEFIIDALAGYWMIARCHDESLRGNGLFGMWSAAACFASAGICRGARVCPS